MTDMWEVLFFVSIICYLIVTCVQTLALHRVFRARQEAFRRWRAMTDHQQELIDDYRRQLGEVPREGAGPPDRPARWSWPPFITWRF